MRGPLQRLSQLPHRLFLCMCVGCVRVRACLELPCMHAQGKDRASRDSSLDDALSASRHISRSSLPHSRAARADADDRCTRAHVFR